MKKVSIYIIILTLILLMQASTFAVSGNPLSLGYSVGAGEGKSTSQFDENIWNYRYQYHVFVLSGDVPQGSLFSQIQLEERDYKTGLAYAKFAISGSTYSIKAGDNVENFSDITLNSISYQGASVTLKPYNNLNFTVVGGSRGNGMWGADVRRDSRPRENFTGIKTEYMPGGGLGLKAIYLTTPTGSQVLSYGSEYIFSDLKFGAEYASANDGKAFQGEVKFQNSWLTLGTIYRDVDSTYVVPFDYTSYKGVKGTYSTVGIKPNRDLTINVQSNSYVDRLNCTTPEAMLDVRGDISYNLPSYGTNIGYSGWRNDRQSEDRGGITEGEMMYITQTFYLITRNAIYYRFQPTWFNSASSNEASYSEEKNIAGINISLFDIAHMNYEIENNIKLCENTDIALNPTAITARLDLFESQIMNSPFYIASSVNYRKDLPNKEVSLESVSIYSDITLKFMPDKDLSCYVTAKHTNIDSPDVDRTARVQNDVSFGLSYSFNTSFYLK